LTWEKNFINFRQNLNSMDWTAHIHSDKDILLGKPVIRGTRIAVEHLVQRLADGWSEEDLLVNYPRLTREDLLAVIHGSTPINTNGTAGTPRP
jgi:uncharacterized protein (DUF433 family)